MRCPLACSLCLLLCGCPRVEKPEIDEADTDTEGDVEVVPPAILEPLDEIHIPVTRFDDLVLPVSDVTLGLTRVLVDDKSVGPLSGRNIIGTLTADALTLRLTGAMVDGTHTVRLRTSGTEEPLDSREIVLRIVPDPPPTIVASIGDEVAMEADSVFATGYDDDGLLVAIDLQASPPFAVVHRGLGIGWDLDAPVTFPLEDLDAGDAPRNAVHAHLHAGEPDPNDDRIRVVWRSGIEGDGLVVGDSPWTVPHPMPRRILDVSDIPGAVEYARLGRPLVLGNDLIVEALLATDVERPRPGDRTLVTIRIAGTPIEASPPRLLRVVGTSDVDALAPTIDVVGRLGGGPHTFAARVDDMRPVLFTVDPGSGELGANVMFANDNVSVLPDLAMPMVTVLGAFGSRQVFGPLRGGNAGARVLLWHIDDGMAGSGFDASPRAAQLEGIGDPTGDAVGTIVHGAPIYLVPMGSDAPAWAFVSTGPEPFAGPVEGLRCDEIAAPVAMVGVRGDRIRVACRRGRDVLIGTLRVQ